MFLRSLLEALCIQLHEISFIWEWLFCSILIIMYLFPSGNPAAKSLQSCPTLCDPRDGSPLGFSVPGILQARTLEWVAISFSNAWKWKVKVKSCPTVHHPMDCSLLGSPVHGIFQARVLEWGAIAFSGGNPDTRLNGSHGIWKIALIHIGIRRALFLKFVLDNGLLKLLLILK